MHSLFVCICVLRYRLPVSPSLNTVLPPPPPFLCNWYSSFFIHQVFPPQSAGLRRVFWRGADVRGQAEQACDWLWRRLGGCCVYHHPKPASQPHLRLQSGCNHRDRSAHLLLYYACRRSLMFLLLPGKSTFSESSPTARTDYLRTPAPPVSVEASGKPLPISNHSLSCRGVWRAESLFHAHVCSEGCRDNQPPCGPSSG